jgi:hypothetical protein
MERNGLVYGSFLGAGLPRQWGITEKGRQAAEIFDREEDTIRPAVMGPDYRQAALELNSAIRHALAWVASGAEPSVAHADLLRTADKWRAVLEDHGA